MFFSSTFFMFLDVSGYADSEVTCGHEGGDRTVIDHSVSR